jgi:hypothetical protein
MLLPYRMPLDKKYTHTQSLSLSVSLSTLPLHLISHRVFQQQDFLRSTQEQWKHTMEMRVSRPTFLAENSTQTSDQDDHTHYMKQVEVCGGRHGHSTKARLTPSGQKVT